MRKSLSRCDRLPLWAWASGSVFSWPKIAANSGSESDPSPERPIHRPILRPMSSRVGWPNRWQKAREGEGGATSGRLEGCGYGKRISCV